MNLCLGTVQLGMDYGIHNSKRPMFIDSMEMLDYAIANGIDSFDTASSYGFSEEIIGAWLYRNPSLRNKVKIISKLKPNILDNIPAAKYYQVMKENLEESLARLGADFLDAYLLHTSQYVFDERITDVLAQLKKEGYIKKTGVSVYYTDEAKCTVANPDLGMIQLPYNIFDQRMLQEQVFETAKANNFTVHSRSAFLQGLLLMKQHEVPEYLKNAIPYLQKLDVMCNETGLSRIQLALGFVKQQEAISHLVFGVENLEQLKEHLSVFEKDIPKDVTNELHKQFSNIDTSVIMPNLWNK